MEKINLPNKVYETRSKAYFLCIAIPEMLETVGNFPSEVALGARMALHEVVKDLEEIEQLCKSDNIKKKERG